MKKHGSLISNVLVVLLVLLAIYVKVNDAEAAPLFRMEDAYLLVGALLGMVVLRFIVGKKQDGKKSGRKDR